jgi:preprotein translocase subunit SecG
MEQNQDTSLFGLGIDPNAKTHLSEAARWAKFLAIVGMVMCVIMVIFGILMSTMVSKATRDMESGFGYPRSMDTGALGVTMMVMYIFIAIIYFFPCLFTLRFANHMQNALTANDQDSLNESFKNLKVTFRYMGILTIIFMALFLLGLLAGGLGTMMGN